MNWSQNPNAIKIVFLIGNGRVDMGAYNFRKAYDEALQNNIIVNTAYCLQGSKNSMERELRGGQRLQNKPADRNTTSW